MNVLKYIALIGVLTLFPKLSDAIIYDFYGHQEQISLERMRAVIVPSSFTKNNVKSAILKLSNATSSQHLQSIASKRVKYNLDDVGVILLTEKISKRTATRMNHSRLIQFTLLEKLGYDVVLTYTRNKIAVFGYLGENPAQSVYINYNNKRYTRLHFDDLEKQGLCYIIQPNPLKNRKIFKLQKDSKPKINAFTRSKKYQFLHNDKWYSITAKTNSSMRMYLKDLPRYKLGETYLNIPISNELESTLMKPLAKFMQEMSSEREKATFLMRFVQQSFKYKNDNEQYGIERYNFPEETLNTVYNDCEDKSLLLAYLLKNLLNIESVMLYFEKDKHVCLGADITGYSARGSFTYKNKSYVVCEPTGKNYRIGQTALDLKRITEVITLM